MRGFVSHELLITIGLLSLIVSLLLPLLQRMRDGRVSMGIGWSIIGGVVLVIAAHQIWVQTSDYRWRRRMQEKDRSRVGE